MSKKSFKSLLDKFNIDETFTTRPKKQKVFNHVKNNVPRKANYNQMADLLFLPECPDGEKYLLVVVDLFTDQFDIEPLKDKTPVNVLKGINIIYKRSYIKSPYGSISTDAGTEFQGVFHKYLHDNDILHKQSLPYRHNQLSNINALCKQLGRLINGYLNHEEEQKGTVQKNWLPILPQLRKELNLFRENNLSKLPNDSVFFSPTVPAKFDIGDVVYHQLDYPENALGHKQNTAVFRTGDYHFSKIPKKITKVILMNDAPFYRFILEGLNNVSYTESQLKKANVKETETKYKVKKIIGLRKVKKTTEYLIWWDGYKKSEATWEKEKQLREDGLGDMIDNYTEHS